MFYGQANHVRAGSDGEWYLLYPDTLRSQTNQKLRPKIEKDITDQVMAQNQADQPATFAIWAAS